MRPAEQFAGRKPGRGDGEVGRGQYAPCKHDVQRRRVGSRPGRGIAPPVVAGLALAGSVAGRRRTLARAGRNRRRRDAARQPLRWREAGSGRYGAAHECLCVTALINAVVGADCEFRRAGALRHTDRVYPPTTLTGHPELGLSSSAQPWALFFPRVRANPPPAASAAPALYNGPGLHTGDPSPRGY
jgi:hypothetical protein